MEKTTPIVVRFSRKGTPGVGIELSKSTEYLITVNNEPFQPFQLPWDEEELDEHIRVLRNAAPDQKPRIEKLEAIGRPLGDALGQIGSFTNALAASAGKMRCVIWVLGWPELAKIPWELATWSTSPYNHMLLGGGMTFVRKVPSSAPRQQQTWPAGQKRSLRLLFAWSETDGGRVPHVVHRNALKASCEDNGVEFVTQRVSNILDLQSLCENTRFDFVHILAHGAKTDAGQWGLSFTNEVIKGEQLARALKTKESIPSLVTLAACDSGAEIAKGEDGSYGSVAYDLHINGIPLVRASLFRLRKETSKYSVRRVYKALLSGDHPLYVLSSMRRKLSPRDNESWANEVVYLGYVTHTLDQTAAVGRQQGALRRAQVIVKKYAETPSNAAGRRGAIKQLETEVRRLRPLVDDEFDLPETYGLLGSLTRRIAYLRSSPPDSEELRDARRYYEKGFRSNAIALYPGIDAIHLSRLLGEDSIAKELVPIVRFTLKSETSKQNPDHWAFATAGELEVYDGKKTAAANFYGKFLQRQGEVVRGRNKRRQQIEAAYRQIQEFIRQLDEKDSKSQRVIEAANESMRVLESGLSRTVSHPKPEVKRPIRKKATAKRVAGKGSASRDTEQVYNVEMLPATMGDSLWIEYGDAAKPNRILIDGGKVDTAKVIKSRINKIVKKEGVCRLELLVVSHIDADHIEGIIKILGDASLQDKLIIDDIWFNGEHHLPDPGSSSEKDAGFLGARQGEFLNQLIRLRRLKWNRPWRGKTIYVPESGRLPRRKLKGGMEIILLSPTFKTLLKLSKRWLKELQKAGLDDATDDEVLEALGHDKRLAPDDEFLSDDGRFLSVSPDLVAQLVAAKTKSDHSAANGSSIAFIGTYNGHNCLFAGDAYSSVLQQSIGRLLKERGEKTLKLGAFKVPHHGSRANLHEGLLKQLDCQNFLVSTDGSTFHHPDREAIAHIVDGKWRKNNGGPVELYFNYRSKENITWNKRTLKKTFNYNVHFPKSKKGGIEFHVP